MCYETGRREDTHYDNNIEKSLAISAMACQDRCLQEAACKYWMYNVQHWECTLKWKLESGPIVNRKDYIHGNKSCPGNMGRGT